MASRVYAGASGSHGGVGMAKLKVFSGRVYFPDSVNQWERQTYVAMATTSQRKFMDATGLSRDYIYRTGNEDAQKAAMAKPERLLFKKGRMYGDGPWKLVPKKHYGWQWKKNNPGW